MPEDSAAGAAVSPQKGIHTMKCTILHESSGRIRVHIHKNKISFEEADKLEYYLLSFSGVSKVKVYERTCDAAVFYDGNRKDIIKALSSFSFESADIDSPAGSSRAIASEYEEKIFSLVIRHFAVKMFLPGWIGNIVTAFKAVKFIFKGIKALIKGKLNVAVLDAVSIAVSLLTGDFSTASSVMFLLGIGDILEEWTHKKSVDDLARTMSLNIEKVWLVVDNEEVLTPVSEICAGDRIVVRTGGMIPLDGRVYSGECLVNQASMTGEPLPVRKSEGDPVFAGTALVEGECVILAEAPAGSGRYDRIIKMIEDSENLKSDAENKSSNMADKLVPFSLGTTVLTYLLTRNASRAVSVLMVDFSCALKLAMPIAMLYAMNEAGRHKCTVKGAKFLEAAAQADTIVFDKTGTLTNASPAVEKIITFGDLSETESLRIAACMEEHYPHSMANAVVEEARRRGIRHDEMHTKINYIVAHGISCEINGEKAIIGSYHFTFEDEGCTIPEGREEDFENLPSNYSHLYMAIGSKLVCVICIDDPVKPEAARVIRELKELGISKTVMMTGDSLRMARSVANELSLDEFYAEVLPEQKAEFVKQEQAKGRKVIMVGDGINDSPALSNADAGIAISDGAAIAREIADITIASDNLECLVTLRKISSLLMQRIRSNYRTIIGFNFMLIILGVLGIVPSGTSALLHNASTILISMHSMTPLLKDKTDEQ